MLPVLPPLAAGQNWSHRVACTDRQLTGGSAVNRSLQVQWRRGQLAGIGIACLAMIGHLVGSWADARERRPALA
jgi:hypothetical protein